MTTLSGEPIQYKINRFTGKMEVAGSTQVRNVLVHLDLGARPQAGKPLIANNKASIPTGAYTIGVTGVVLDGVPSTSYTAGASAITGIDPAVTEVVLSFAETTFMDKNLKAVFDDEPVKRPKYQKLKDTIQIVRL
jgi:hypothetical protein